MLISFMIFNPFKMVVQFFLAAFNFSNFDGPNSFFPKFNKSAAGMQHTPPGLIFNANKMILKLDLFMQSLKKISEEMPKIETEQEMSQSCDECP